MAFLFGAPHPKHQEAKDSHAVFHGDADLHDQRPGAMKWFQNLGSDIPAALRLAAGKFGAEAAVAECAKLPLNDPLSKYLTGQSVNTLWGSLLHPPLSYRGNLLQYRTADGSANSFLHPQLGKAGEPYAKSVPAEVPVQGARPDPGDLFDLLMAHQGSGPRSTSSLGISSMLLYHATIIIHDIFRSHKDDKNISDTSSYLDLTPLYGRTLEYQKAVRQMKDGLLKPDSFAEERLLHQPPGVCIYLIMYSRFHNYVAQQLKNINENGKFSLPANFGTLSKEEQKKAEDKIDEDLFQTARLITCGLYINISIHDYLRVLMRLHAKDTPWTLDPRIEIPGKNNKEGIQRGIGNQVSCEFNMLYRFHSPISNRDSKWTDDFLRKTFAPLVEKKKLTPQQLEDLDIPVEMMRAAIELQNKSVADSEKKAVNGAKPDNDAESLPYLPEGLGFRARNAKGEPIGKFPFARDPKTGRFNDDQLVKEMVNVLHDPICNFGPQNTPRAFKAIEIMGILQARKWELATLNEFRGFFGLPKHTRFEDINGDKKVQDALRDLYGDPDMVELYPGLFCEGGGDYDPKTGKSSKLDPGTSCPGGRGTALWRGVFSDAITLVRSDRFYTIDWNVASLTAWGMREVTSDPDILKGSVFHRLWQRAFPGYFKYNSVMLWQPFYTPMKNLELAAQQSNYLEQLDERKGDLERNPEYPEHVWRWKSHETYPAKQRAPIVITDYAQIFKIVQGEDSKLYANPGVLDFKAIPGKALQQVMSGDGSLGELSEALGNLVNDNEQSLILEYFHSMSKTITKRERRQMQKRKSGTDYVYQIDIIKDYAVPVITRFVADFLGFGHEIKTEEVMDRKYDESQIYKHFTHCQDFLTFNADDTTAWKRRVEFTKSMRFLKELTEHAVDQAQPGLLELFSERSYGTAQDGEHVKHVRKFGVQMARYLVKEKRKSTQDAAAIMLYTAIDATYKCVLIFSNVLSYFLEQSNVKHWAAIQELANRKVKTPKETKDINKELMRYVMEAQRINADHWIVRTFRPTAETRSTNVNALGADGKTHVTTLRGSEQLVLKVKPASQDPDAFPNPKEINLNRDLQKYIYYGSTPQSKFSTPKLTIIALTGMIKYAAKLPYLRLAHDTTGRLKTADTPDGWGSRYLSPQWDQLLPFPTTWNLRFDGLEEGKGVYDGPDNSRTGNNISQMFSLNEQSAVGGTLNTLSEESNLVVNGIANGFAKYRHYEI